MNVHYWFDRTIRYLKYHKYQEKYGFSSWHMEPVSSKPYVDDVIGFILKNAHPGVYAVECGCGLGDIIANSALQHLKRVGIDCKEEIIKADKEIYKKEMQTSKLSFEVGSFEVLNAEKIGFLVAVNFLHNIDAEQVKENLTGVLSRNEVEYFIVDSVNSSNYRYCHDFDFLINFGYYKKCLGKYEVKNGTRFLLAYGKKHENM